MAENELAIEAGELIRDVYTLETGGWWFGRKMDGLKNGWYPGAISISDLVEVCFSSDRPYP